MGLFSSAFSAVASFAGSMVSGLSSFAVKYGPTIFSGLSQVSQVICSIAQAFGIFKQDEKIEDMGDRAIQAAESGIQMENYGQYDDYLEAIRNFKLDPEKSKSIDTSEKVLAGIGIACKGVEDKFDLPTDFGGMIASFVAINPSYFTSDRIENWLKADSGKTIIQYFDNKLNPDDSIHAVESIIKAEKSVYPAKSDGDVWQDISAAKETLNQKES